MKYAKLIVVLWVLSSLLLAKVQAQSSYTQQGKASYYASKFNGRKTANGEKFTNDALTAAHPSLAFNSMVKVTNVNNGKWVIVRINDRGPHTKARILDMSKAAAQEIDMIQSGIATVNIEVLGTDSRIDPTQPRIDIVKPERPTIQQPAPDPDKKISIPFISGHTYSIWGTERFPSGYGIQIASFVDVTNARDVCKELLAAKIEEAYIQVEWKSGEKIHRVLAGSFKEQMDAQVYIQTLEKLGFEGFVKRHF